MIDNQFTDVFFEKALKDISANHTLFFTPRQLFHLLDRRLQRKAIAAAGYTWVGLGIVLGIIGFFTIAIGIGLILLIGAVIWIVLSMIRSRRQPKYPRPLLITQNRVEEWLSQWQTVNSTPKLLPYQPPAPLPQAAAPSDVTNYSFDRLVVCDRDRIAQLLIANNFHFEYNCAILSINRYPQTLFETTMQMLRRNPDLKVYALHDCSPSGVSLVHQLRTDLNWFVDGTAIVEVGLLPRQILAAPPGMMIQTSPKMAKAAQNLPIAIQEGLSDAELSWLKAGQYVELESFTSQRLIRILNRAITTDQEITLTTSDASTVSGGDLSFYVVDSFG